MQDASSSDSRWTIWTWCAASFQPWNATFAMTLFCFPNTDFSLRYYASGMVAAIENRPVDNGHRERLLELVGEGVEAIIAQEGVFRDPKPAGCFVVTKT